MPLFDYTIWHRWLNPLAQTIKMLGITAASTFAMYPSEMLSRPWEWVLKPEIITYWLEPHYIGMISPTIWALIIPTVAYITYKVIKGAGTKLNGSDEKTSPYYDITQRLVSYWRERSDRSISGQGEVNSFNTDAFRPRFNVV